MRGFLFALILGMASTTIAPSARALQKLRVGFPSLATALSPVWVTYDKRFWKKYGVDAEPIFLSGATVSALISGAIQVVVGSDPEITMAILKGAKLVRLGVTTNSLGSSLLVQQKINSIGELKGKVIGIGSRGGSSLELRLSELLRENGIDPKRDVSFLPIGGGPPARVAALEKGVIIAAMITPPFDKAAERGGLKILSKINVPLIAGGINTTLSFRDENRGTLIGFLKGYMEGIRYMTAHRDQTLRIFSRYLKSLDPATISYFYDEIAGRVQKDLQPKPKSVRFLLDVVAMAYPEAKQLSEKDYWDLSLIDEIERSGFLQQLYAN